MNAEQGRWDGDALTADIPEETKRSRRRAILIAGIVLLIIGAVAFAMLRAKPSAKPAAPTLPSVTVVVPGHTAVSDVITATGLVAAKRDMPVGVAGEGGMVNRVLVDAGQWVRAGQVLATVDPSVQVATTSQTQAQVASAEANAKLAQSQLDRAARLVDRGFISKSDVEQRVATRDAAIAQVKLAQAQYREQAARLGRLDIRAPTQGLVLERDVEPGQIVSSGSNALFRMAMGGEMELRARLAEQQLAALHVGMPVQVTPIGSAQTYTGTIWQISPTIDPTTRQGEVRVQLAYAPSLRPGGFASARFSSDPRQAPVLPESAVMSDAKGANFVYIVGADDRVVRRPVRVGDVSDTGLAILDGLDGSERVVYSAGAFLNPGDKVIPKRKAGQ